MAAKGAARNKTKSKQATAVPEPAPPSRLLLRVHSAKGLPHESSSQGLYCKLYVGETAMTHGSQRGLFCSKKKTTAAGNEDAVGKAAEAGEDTDTHRVFRTKSIPQPEKTEDPAVWDENFDVLVLEAAKDILSVRVKSKHRLYPTVFGACAIPLKQLRVGRMWDQWVPVIKGTREVATLRVQLLLSPLHEAYSSTERTRGVLQADIKTALAANQSADEAIERLVLSATFRKARDGSDDHDHSHEQAHLQDDKVTITASAVPIATASV